MGYEFAIKAGGKCITVDPTYGQPDMWHIYPADYGAQCEVQPDQAYEACYNKSTMDKTSDPMVPPEELNPAADWCTEKWCYVDPCKCDAPGVTESTAFQSHDQAPSYTYSTCEGTDTWTAEQADKKLGASKCADVDASGVPGLRSSSLLGSLFFLRLFF